MPNRADLAKIHIAAKELGIENDDYRFLLWDRYKKNSAKDLSQKQTWDLLSHFQSRGWKVKRPSSSTASAGGRMASDPQSRKIRALWITMHKAGMVRDGSERALGAYVKRMTGVDRLEWCEPGQKHRVIEALKKWQSRVEGS